VVAGDGDFKVAGFELDAGIPGIEPGLLALDGNAQVGQRRREIEDGCVGGVGRGDAGGVLVAMRLVERVDEGQNLRLGGCGGGAERG
jgi:hypothetical protein